MSRTKGLMVAVKAVSSGMGGKQDFYYSRMEKLPAAVHADLAQSELRVLSMSCRDTKCLSTNKHTDQSTSTLLSTIK
jgi:hypothetical protein